MNDEKIKQKRRRIPVEGDFMKTMYSDKWYAYLQCISVKMAHEGEDIYVVFKKDDLFAKGCKVVDINVSTARRKHTKLIEGGFIEEIAIEDNYNSVKTVYKISQINTLYQMVDVSVLEVLYKLKTESMIKIYAYLLNKFVYYKDKEYIFTKGELIEKCLGLKNKDDKNSLEKVTIILSVLNDMDLVKWQIIKQKTEFGYTFRLKLTNVATKYVIKNSGKN